MLSLPDLRNCMSNTESPLSCTLTMDPGTLQQFSLTLTEHGNPHHTASNGFVELVVKMVKTAITKAKYSDKDP